MRRVIIASVVVLIAGGVSLAGLRLQRDSGESDTDPGSTGGITSARLRFDAAVARAQDAEGDTIKVTYRSESDGEYQLTGEFVVARRGDHYLFTASGQVDGGLSVVAFGRDAEGDYACFAFLDSDGIWMGFFGDEPGCQGDDPEEEAEPDEDDAVGGNIGDEDFLKFFTGGLKVQDLVRLFFDGDGDVTAAGARTVAGLASECFQLKDTETDLVICLSAERGLITFAEGTANDETARLELTAYTSDLTDEDLDRPVFPDNSASIPHAPVTIWAGAEGAFCPAGTWLGVTALTVDSAGDVWFASYDHIFVLTPSTCAMRQVVTGYENSGGVVMGLAVGGNGVAYATLSEGRVIEVNTDGSVTELLGETESRSFGESVLGPALFADGSVAVLRTEGTEDDPQVVLYRITGGSVVELNRHRGLLFFDWLATVPGAGVATLSHDLESEVLVTEAGVTSETGFAWRSPFACRAYASAEVGWQQFDGWLLRTTASGEVRRYRFENPSELQCQGAAVAPDGSLWLALDAPGGIYQVEMTDLP